MNNALATVEVYPDSIIVTQQNENGFSTSKTVSPEGLSQAFSVNTKLDSGFLPCVEGIVQYVRHDNKVLLVYQVPTKTREITYRDNSLNKNFKNVRIPYTLFLLLLQQQNDAKYYMIQEYCYAMKGPLLTQLDSLYRFPFTNVHSNAQICWGGNTTGYSWNSLAGLISHIELFYDSPFNAHLDDGNYAPLEVKDATGRTARLVSVAALLKHLEGAPTFPNQVLKDPHAYKNIFDNMLKHM
jgi:hypothetical protein